MTKNDDFTLALLTNREVLEIGKESFCAHPLTTTDLESVWIAPRKDGQGSYVALFNLNDEMRAVTIPMESLECAPRKIRELWTGAETQSETEISAALPPHDCAVFLLR